MPIRFIKPEGEYEVGCYRSLNLLAHAQMIELNIGSECGGHGVCGKDRIQILPIDQIKISPPTDHETEHLSVQEIADGYRLACQCFPSEDDLSFSVKTLS
jgi:ferredoxin